jgi:hypothetical protein
MKKEATAAYRDEIFEEYPKDGEDTEAFLARLDAAAADSPQKAIMAARCHLRELQRRMDGFKKACGRLKGLGDPVQELGLGFGVFDIMADLAFAIAAIQSEERKELAAEANAVSGRPGRKSKADRTGG